MSLGIGKLIIAQARIGNYYNGGLYMGIHTSGSDKYRLILARNVDSASTTQQIWGNPNQQSHPSAYYTVSNGVGSPAVQQATSTHDGVANITDYMNLDSGYHDIAEVYYSGSTIYATENGYSDWYWPSSGEMALIHSNADELPANEYFSSDLYATSTNYGSGDKHYIYNPDTGDILASVVNKYYPPTGVYVDGDPYYEFKYRHVRRELI
jgi:hypothetical protein